MAKVLKCGDVRPGCDFEIRGESEEEIFRKAADHARSSHGLQNIPIDLLQKVRDAIRDVPAEPNQAKPGTRGASAT
jgi:predicted small metal-binding protein